MMEDIFSVPNPPLSCLSDESAFASGSGKSPTCLVVEDDGTMRHLVTSYLEDNDIRAVSASRRDEVISLLTRHRPDRSAATVVRSEALPVVWRGVVAPARKGWTISLQVMVAACWSRIRRAQARRRAIEELR